MVHSSKSGLGFQTNTKLPIIVQKKTNFLDISNEIVIGKLGSGMGFHFNQELKIKHKGKGELK